MLWAVKFGKAVMLSGIGFFLLCASSGLSISAELVMFRQIGCEWCEAWDSEIGAIYHKTAEGRRLPLRQVDIHENRPEDLTNLKPVVFTPTFIVHENGEEVGRILGYTGESFFWGLLDQIMSKLASKDQAVSLPRSAQ